MILSSTPCVRLFLRYDDGVKDITNIDFSRVVIKQMMKKNLRARPEMKWQIMDMTAMKVRAERMACAFLHGTWCVCESDGDRCLQVPMLAASENWGARRACASPFRSAACPDNTQCLLELRDYKSAKLSLQASLRHLLHPSQQR